MRRYGITVAPPRSRRTVTIPPTVAVASERHFELASDYLRARRIPEALAAYEQAASQGFDADQCAAGRWECWMLLGRFERAWQESDLIARGGAPDPYRFWAGLPFAGKRVIIRCLHGFGDAIQFIRYAPLMRRDATDITVETHPELVALLRGVPSVDRVITWTDTAPPYDRQIEVMELPRAFGTTVHTIPAQVPYIEVDPTRAALDKTDCAKIGIVWASSNWNPERSIPLYAFDPVFHLPGMKFYSLQFGPEAAGISGPLHDLSAHSFDIVDTASTILNLDLVITVDTMVAHLAGALGKPVWTLLPFRADWRWMLERSDSPWYPTMRLFRQPSPGDWTSVIDQVIKTLRAM